MKMRTFAGAAAVIAALVTVAPAVAEDYANPHLIVTAGQLRENLEAPDVVIVDVRPADAFAEGHIPGARHLDPDAVVDPDAPTEGALRQTDALVRIFADLGISADKAVVLYDDKGGFHAARMFWLLEYHGHDQISILDGGLPAWAEAGLPLAKGEAGPVAAETYAVALTPRRHASADYIVEHRDDDDLVVIDVRPADAFAKGHIPSAINIPWKGNLAEDGRMKSADALRAHFASHGVTEDSNVVVHCQVGLASSHSYLAMRLLGFPRVRTYHRSWAEWGSADDLPKAMANEG